MKIEALNCPNCGAGALSDSTRCDFCHSRLKTMTCPSCFGLLFIGSKHCSHCGKKTVLSEPLTEEKAGDCPRCKLKLNLLQINNVTLRECQKCSGMWSDAETFESICAERENQANILSFIGNKKIPLPNTAINYVPCPDCKTLMNRNNFARSSGIILDICKQHGVWFDAEELPKVIAFIRRGGLDQARQKEKIGLEEKKRELIDLHRKNELRDRRFQQTRFSVEDSYSLSVKDFLKRLFD